MRRRPIGVLGRTPVVEDGPGCNWIDRCRDLTKLDVRDAWRTTEVNLLFRSGHEGGQENQCRSRSVGPSTFRRRSADHSATEGMPEYRHPLIATVYDSPHCGHIVFGRGEGEIDGLAGKAETLELGLQPIPTPCSVESTVDQQEAGRRHAPSLRFVSGVREALLGELGPGQGVAFVPTWVRFGTRDSPLPSP